MGGTTRPLDYSHVTLHETMRGGSEFRVQAYEGLKANESRTQRAIAKESVHRMEKIMKIGCGSRLSLGCPPRPCCSCGAFAN